jgi:hypothetical protein
MPLLPCHCLSECYRSPVCLDWFSVLRLTCLNEGGDRDTGEEISPAPRLAA